MVRIVISCTTVIQIARSCYSNVCPLDWVGPLILCHQEVNRIPSQIPGIYLLHTFSVSYGWYQPIYVGKTTDLLSRLIQHLASDSTSADYASGPGEVTGWAGWVGFAGIMLIMLGVFQAIEGFVAIFDDGYYLVRPNGLVINVDYTAWGWLHLIIGLIAVAVGVGLMAGNMVARVVGVIVAVISATLNLLFIGAYPVWSTIIIAVDVIVIYAIVVHGRELKA